MDDDCGSKDLFEAYNQSWAGRSKVTMHDRTVCISKEDFRELQEIEVILRQNQLSAAANTLKRIIDVYSQGT